MEDYAHKQLREFASARLLDMPKSLGPRWKDSMNEFLVLMGNKEKGAAFEKIIMDFMAYFYGFDAHKRLPGTNLGPSSDHDFVLDGVKYELKISKDLRDKDGLPAKFRFNQIRPQQFWDVVLCVGYVPNGYCFFWAKRDDVGRDIATHGIDGTVFSLQHSPSTQDKYNPETITFDPDVADLDSIPKYFRYSENLDDFADWHRGGKK